MKALSIYPEPHGNGSQEKPAPDGRRLPLSVQHHDKERMPRQIGGLHDEVDDTKSLHGPYSVDNELSFHLRGSLFDNRFTKSC